MDSLNTFAKWTFIMLTASLLVGCFLIFLTRRRDLWLSYVNREMSLWLRWGMPLKLVNAVRRLYESRGFIHIVRITFLLCVLVTLLHGGSYLYFKSKLKQNIRPTSTRL
jgi:hypothetical protein